MFAWVIENGGNDPAQIFTCKPSAPSS
jgi:hypothetical protein